MREISIRVEPFEFVQLLSYSSEKAVNEHGTVSFSGVIEEANKEKYLSMAMGEVWIKCIAIDENFTEQVIFAGIVTDFEIQYENDVHILCVQAKTGSYLMDLTPHIRTFQDGSLTYNQVQDSFISNYLQGDYIMTKGDGQAIQNLIVQYQETDWEFAKRIASHFEAFLVPDSIVGGVKYIFGMPGRKPPLSLDSNLYSVKKKMEEYAYKKARGVDGLEENDALYYILEQREIHEIGQNILLNDTSLYIYAVHTQLVGAELYHTYYLKTENGFKLPKQYNNQLIGASLQATVLSVEKDVVEVTCEEDENSGNTGTRWFPYSTPYSSPDGTGWYCMPEPGDAVRLYLPNQDEASGYVASAAHLESSNSEERANPDFKSIMNKYGKEVLFTPDSLILTNNAGMSIEILDNQGIRIVSSKAINLAADDAVTIGSANANLQVVAPQSVTLQQGGTVIQLKDTISFSGAQVHLD